MSKNDFQKIFLILAGAAAISAGKLADKYSMQDINQATHVELINEADLNQDATKLTTQKCNLIKEKAEKIFANLNIENLQEKSIKEKEEAAFQLLKYIIYITKENYVQKEHHHTNQFEYEINLIYQLLCAGKNIAQDSQIITLNFLYQICGLESQHATIQKDAYILTKSGKKPTKIQHEIILIDFGEGQRICDPSYTKVMQGPLLRQKDPRLWSDAFFSSQYYFEKINPNYQIITDQNTTALNTELVKTTINNDISIER